MTKKPLITVDNISVRLGGTIYLEDISWSIHQGEHWVILGPNGSGKTSLVKALFGDVQTVKGTIVPHFIDTISPHRPTRRDYFGYVSLEMHRKILEDEEMKMASRDFSGNIGEITTVAEIVLDRLPKENTRDSDRRALMEKWASRLGNRHLLERNILSISTGEMAKVLILRALMKDPRVLILDEPYDGLDMKSRLDMQQTIRELMGRSLTVILITHRIDEIFDEISHVLCLKAGRVQSVGEKDKVLRNEIMGDVFEPDGRKSWGLIHRVGDLDVKPLSGANGGASPSSLGEILIRMTDVVVKYGDRMVLDHLSWTTRDGENWVLFGPNGAGKSTTLKMITGENQQAYANEIYLFGKKKGSGESIWSIKKKIGFLSAEFQASYPRHFQAFDVVCSGFFDSIGLYRRCSEEQLEIAEKWIEMLGVAGLASHRFDQLSYGLRRLVLIARAMVKSPLLLILDEPSDGLDMVNRARLKEMLEFVGGHTGTNLIYVTHHEEEILACTTHMMRLEQGKVVGIELRSPPDP